MPLRLYNTLTRKVEPFRPGDPSHITFYSCGPTVYDDAHIGNFRSFLAADLLRRWIESPLCELENDTDTSSHARRVTHVMNITDVGHMTDDAEGGEQGEDRMAVAGRRIAEAKKSGKLPADAKVDPSDPYQIARFYEGRFKDDARTLGLKLVLDADTDPSLTPRATDNIEGMKAVIKRLLHLGYAYTAGTPGQRVVYFDVQKFTPYGRLSGNTLDRLREGEGGRVSGENQSQKHHPADFLLWKEDPSHIMKWDSPASDWGPGYPGWHIECTAMSISRLSERGSGASPSADCLASLSVMNGEPLIDLHSGGEDNIFPHHECEIAQSCCAFNQDPKAGSFARMWFHPRFLFVEGAKMSKSKGNFFTARDLFDKGYEPAAVRLELIRTHYRSNADFREQGLKDCQRMIDRWRRVADEGAKSTDEGNTAARAACRHDFATSLDDDLNIAQAIAAVNAWVGAITTPVAADARLMKQIDDVLGVLSLQRPQSATTEIGLYVNVAPDPAVEALLTQRQAARAKKDFAASDAIRDQLAKMGYAVKDVAGGKVEVRRA
ncbi:MAG TPA: cysteine--tRNA ligase [Phycisphaerales bacterium]|nr:cysteine--tRNA ligase [Phycisphaerales bacterium]